jgi:hypothetical protein
VNVNYPPLTPAFGQGVRLAVQGRTLLFLPSYEEPSPGVFQSTARPVRPTRDVPGFDSIPFCQGFATVVPIDGDYTAATNLNPRLLGRIVGLRP